MTSAILAPAVGVMNRLRFTGKFAVVILVLMAVVGALVALLYNRLDAAIVHAQSELDGLKIIRPLTKAVQFTQQHRGLSAAVIGGKPERKPEVEAKGKDVEAQLAQAEGLLPDGLRRGAEWSAIRADWGKLSSEGMNLQLSANIAAHTRLIGLMLNFVTEVSDSYRLTQDPEVGSFYLMDTALVKLPTLLETLGRMRANGTGVLAVGKLEPAQGITLNIALASIADLRGQYERNLTKTKRENASVAATLDASAQKFTSDLEQLVGVVRDDVLGQKFATPAASFFSQATTTIDIGYTQMFETLLPTLEQLINQRIERMRSQMTMTLLAIGAALVLAAYLVAGMYHAVTANIRRLVEGADSIASGDLTVRINLPCEDELKQVAGSFNAMATSVNNTVRNVRTNADAVSSAAERTATSSGEIALSSQSQSEAASSMAAAVEETTVGIDHISTNAREAREISARSGELSAQGGDLVQTVVQEMGEIASAVTASASAVEELGRRSDEISSIVEVIKEIADQTNLLALNAAIEAARAGEQGRGFAVVADEVRKLAERTGKSTQQISAMIGSIQQETRAAVEAMKAGVEKVDRGVELTSRAGESMAEVRRGAEQVVEVVREISDALREQTTASTDIARNVETIAQMAEENSAAVAENHATVEQLEKLAAALQGEVARFKVS
ncbi:MAG: methyl-accepting chemotaxis protein [Pseudomonadota bacterium]|nr:methyl-accepting chemotaxis protein [Pseudomonadota bacterium]